MSKSAKTWLIIATCLLLIGCIIFGSVMTMLNWNFEKLSTDKFVTNEYTIEEAFENILIETNTASIKFLPCKEAEASVICYEQKNEKHSVVVKDNTLEIKINNTKKWYEYIGINLTSPKITIHLPESDYSSLKIKSSTGAIEIPEDFKFQNVDISESTGSVALAASASDNVKIKTTTGSIRVDNITVGRLELSVSTGSVTLSDTSCEGDVNIKVSTGKAELSNLKCKNLNSSGDTGSISLENVIAKEKFSIKRSTGNIKFDGSDANEIWAQTDTGDITGTLLTDKVFITKTDTGKINVPSTTSGGKCEITTDTGDIKIKLR